MAKDRDQDRAELLQAGRSAQLAETRAADHAVGVELELEEVAEQRRWALAQGRDAEAGRLAGEIGRLADELARSADIAARRPGVQPDQPVFHGPWDIDADTGTP